MILCWTGKKSGVTYSVQIKRSAAQELGALSVSNRTRVAQAIGQLAENPYIGTVLKGGLRGLRRVRVGDYRILYEVHRNELVVLAVRIGARDNVYRRTAS